MVDALMTFVRAVRAGAVPAARGELVANVLVEFAAPLGGADVDAITAEAFARDVFDAEAVTWDQARAAVALALADVPIEGRPDAMAAAVPRPAESARQIDELPATFARTLTAVERRCDMAEKRQTFEDVTAPAATLLAELAEAMVADIQRRVRRDGLGLRDTDPTAVEALAITRTVVSEPRTTLRDLIERAYARGARDGRGELARARRQDLAASNNVGVVGTQARRYFKAKSFWITGILEDQLLARAKATLFTALASDRTPTQVEFELDRALNEFLPVRDRARRLVNVPHRIETIARTQLADAVNQGRWGTFTDPELDGFVTAFQYSAVLDSRTRDNHAAWDGVTLAANDPTWTGPPDRRPPNGFSCRCVLVPITELDEAELTEAIPSVEVVDDGFK